MKAALRIAVYYALLSGLYIVFSDWAVDLFSHQDPDVVRGWQNLKGIAFVAGSAAIIFFLILHYVQGRNRAEEQREEARKSFEHLFRRNPLPVFVYDTLNLEFLAVNEAAVEEYGYEEKEFLRLALPIIHPAEDVEKLLAHVTRAKPGFYTGHWRHQRKDGSPVEMEIISHPIKFTGREARLVVAVNIGIRKITERALADAFAAHAEAEEVKTRFLSTISHEMRTPLNAIVGFLDLLPKENDEQLRAEYVAIAQRGADELLALIERLIEAAMLNSSGNVRHHVEDVELRPFLERITDCYVRPAQRKNIALDFGADDSLPVRALLDAPRVEAILEILVGNAIKFSDDGTIRLQARCRESSSGRELTLAIVDQGIGIPSAERERIFDSFFQVDQGRSRKYGGLGMGLFVARQLCDLVGARIQVESGDSFGSTFSVILPGTLDDQGRFVVAGNAGEMDSKAFVTAA